MVVNTAYVFVVMLSSKAKTLRFWALQWENLDWNNFTSPPPDPFTSFLVCDNIHSLISLQALPHRLLKPSFFPFWPDYDTSSFETLFMLSSPLRSFLLCAISFKDPHNFYSLFNPSGMLPNALSPLQVLPNLFWQLRWELAHIVPIICKIFHSVWGSGLFEERKCPSLHNLFWKIFLKLPVNLFGSQQRKYGNEMGTFVSSYADCGKAG